MRKFWMVLDDFSKQMSKKNISAFSASTAFFMFLSLIPMLIMLCTIIPFTPLTEENLLAAVTNLTPDTFDPLLSSIISEVYDKSAGILSIAAVATIWSAGKGVLALIRGLNAIDGVEENRNYFLLRTVACFYTLIFMVILILSLFLMVFGNVIVDFILHDIPQIQTLFQALMHFRFLLVWVVLTILFTFIYSFVPNKKMKIRSQIPGAAFAAVVWGVFSWGFSVYVENYDGVTTYGSLSIIILIMLWLYFCINIIMTGAYINRYFAPIYRVLFGRRKRKALDKTKEIQ